MSILSASLKMSPTGRHFSPDEAQNLNNTQCSLNNLCFTDGHTF